MVNKDSLFLESKLLKEFHMRFQISQGVVMKLTGIFPQIKTEKIQKSGSVDLAKPVRVSTALGGDRVELSSGSREVMKMQEILQETPEVRREKVDALKRQIEEGTYQVDPQKVADKMMWSLISD